MRIFLLFLAVASSVHAFAPLYSSASVNAHALNPNDNPFDNKEALTKTQIKELRKEVSQRAARKQLPEYFYTDDDAANQESIAKLLQENELVQVRSVSKDNPRNVYKAAQQLAFDLKTHLIQVKGHTVVLYTPGDDGIKLRNSYQPNAWSRRLKAKRDRQGQVIPGEYE
jgi:RNA-binding protein YhbY